MINFRIVSEDDREAVEKLWAYCFENHEPFFSWYFREYYQTVNTLGAFDQDRLLSCVQLIPYDIYLRGKKHSVSYLVGVASFPEARGGGTIKNLLYNALAEMRERKQAFSLLMPFRAEFYQPYSWEFCYHHCKYTIAMEELGNAVKEHGSFIPVTNQNRIREMDQIYSEMVKDKHGYVIRTERNWQLLLEDHFGEKGFIYLLQNEKNWDGYVMYYLKENKIIIREAGYKNIDAQRAFLKFVYNHRSQVEKLEWNAPINDLTHLSLKNPQTGVNLYPFLMARIVDVKSALRDISYPMDVKAKIVISVDDKFVDWNNGTFKLKIEGGKAEIVFVDEDPDLEICIGSLTQLIFGRLSVTDLLFQEKLIIKTPKILDYLRKIFPSCVNYINEYY